MDEALLVAINGLRSPMLDGLLGFVGEWGHCAYPLALMAFLAWKKRAIASDVRDGLLAFLLALFVAETALKPLFGRVRPTAIPALLEQLHVLGSMPSARSLSMPSGTATACAAGAAWIWIRFGCRAGVPAAVFALFVGLARLYAGVHWPSDVAVGFAVGAFIAIGVDRFTAWAVDERSHLSSR
jgi:undecaprenyl-diphosphatase